MRNATPAEDEKLIDPVDAIEQETGRRIHNCTSLRWMVKGRKGCRLKFMQFGRSKLTCRLWVREFLDTTTQAESPEPLPPSPSARRREITSAKKQLADLLK